MCGSAPSPAPAPAPAPAPPPAPIASPEDNTIVSGSSARKRSRAIAAGRGGNLTGRRGVLGEANIGKTLLGS